MMRLSLLLLVLLWTVPAQAQVNTLERENPRENARLKLGPLYLTPSIALTEFGVDTNVFNENGEPRKDFTITVAPAARFWVPIARRGLISGSFDSDLVWYKEFSTERSIDPSLTLRGEAYLRRFTVFAQNAFLRSRQRPSFEIDQRSRRVQNTATAGVDVRLTPKLSLELHGSRSDVEFDGDAVFLGTSLEKGLNRRSLGVGVVGRYRMSALTSFALRSERFEERFPLSPERGADNVRVMVGAELEPRALINGSAFVGVRHLNPVDEARLPEFAGFVSDLALSYTLLGEMTFGVSHVRDVRYSFEPLQPYYLDTGAGIHVRRGLGPRFDVVLSVDRHAYAYRNLLGVESAAAFARSRVDTIFNYGGSVGYRLGRDGRLGFGISYWKRNSSTNASRRYDGLRIGTTAAYDF